MQSHYQQPPEQAAGGKDQFISAERFDPAPEMASRPQLNRWARPLMTVLLLAVCGIAAWFVLTAKSLSLELYPPTAKVSLQGFHVKWADRVLLRRGEYAVRITAPGYFPQEDVVVVGEESLQRRAFSLRKLPGQLHLTTSPVEGAQVEIDGRMQGQTPLTIPDLEAGEHRIRVQAERYLPWEKVVVVEGKDSQQHLELTLTPAWGELTVASQPAGAKLYIDGKDQGRTPQSLEVSSGEHTLQLRHPGYQVWQKQFTLAPQESLTLPVIALRPAAAALRLESNPSQASVLVNGEYQGQTPLELSLSPNEAVTLRLFKEGYQSTSRTLAGRAGEQKRLRLDLEPELASIAISAEPPDAQLYVDGVAKGTASQTLQLPARPHQVAIRKEGYVDYETTVIPRPGLAQQLRAQLKTVEQAHQEAIKPRIETTAGQKLRLMRPKTPFIMGASRREPGRRANETLRQVKLTRPFYLALHEVTNREFKAYDPTHSSGRIQHHSLDTPEQPVVNITWEQAAQYCNWLSEQDSLPPFYKISQRRVVGFNPNSHGYRLPTEAEWAWAARVDSDKLLKFPWGEAFPPPPQSGNYADESAAGIVGMVLKGYQDGFAVSAPAGRFPPNAKGFFALGDNVAEWVHDVYTITSETEAMAVDPLGVAEGKYHVIRGASWAHATLTELRLSFRDYNSEGREDVGFRVARYLER